MKDVRLEDEVLLMVIRRAEDVGALQSLGEVTEDVVDLENALG
jgi:hypothetical protein